MENDDEKGDGDCLHRPLFFFCRYSLLLVLVFGCDDARFFTCVYVGEKIWLLVVVVLLLLLTVCVCNKRKVGVVWVLGLRILMRMFYPS